MNVQNCIAAAKTDLRLLRRIVDMEQGRTAMSIPLKDGRHLFRVDVAEGHLALSIGQIETLQISLCVDRLR